MTTVPPDPRRQRLCAWLGAQLDQPFELRPASSDASFRRYFRASAGARTWIVMDAPPPQEDCRPFVAVARLLREAGVHAPEVFAADLDQGFLLLTDLGDTTYLAALGGAGVPTAADATIDALYADALDALVRMQAASRPGVLTDYDRPRLATELALFPEWYLGRHLGLELPPAGRTALDAVFARVLANNLAQPRAYVHRDYHARNLMVTAEHNPGVLDFQDAVFGPVSYDLVSLLKDAYVVWGENRVRDWTGDYWQRARGAGVPVPADFDVFWRDFEWMGVQRHLKVLGIFARLWHRDGKEAYLADMPRVYRALLATCHRHPELDALSELLERTGEPGGERP